MNDPEFEDVVFAALNFKKGRTPYWNLAAYPHYDSGGGSSFGTPFGIYDLGHIFFRGSRNADTVKRELRQAMKRRNPGANVQAVYQMDGDNVKVDVRVENRFGSTLGSSNGAYISVGLLENKKDPYFVQSIFDQAGGALCGTIEDGESVDCTLSLNGVTRARANAAQIVVGVSYKPDMNKQTHDSLQIAVAEPGELGSANEPPTVAEPIDDIELPQDSPEMEIDLGKVFTDPDDDDELIEYLVYENTNEDLITTNISGKALKLTVAPGQTGYADITIRAKSNGETVRDTFRVIVIESADEPPTIASPIADVSVDQGTLGHDIDLSGVFTDPDNDNASITKAVTANSNIDLVDTQIVGDTLSLIFSTDMFGTAEITVTGTSNGKMVEDTFSVTVNERVDSPMIFMPSLSNGN